MGKHGWGRTRRCKYRAQWRTRLTSCCGWACDMDMVRAVCARVCARALRVLHNVGEREELETGDLSTSSV